MDVYGAVIDNQTRCAHYHQLEDIIAIKMKCCQKYYPCYQCHQEAEDHRITVWEKHELDEFAILCGVCQTEHTINQYLRTNQCLHCQSAFNQACQNHYHLYFDYNAT